MYSAGRTVLEIAEEFFLSPETIKKIVYGKKVTLPEYLPSATSAEQYANAGMGEEWLRNFMTRNFMEKPDFTVPYQEAQVKELKETKRNSYAAFIIVKNENYTYFWNNFGKHFQR